MHKKVFTNAKICDIIEVQSKRKDITVKGQTKQILKIISYIAIIIALIYFSSMMEADRVIQLGM